jgi:undecaprenyl-diphosphatase
MRRGLYITAAAVAAVSLLSFVALGRVVSTAGAPILLDVYATAVLFALRSPVAGRVFLAATYAGGPWSIAALAAFAALVLLRRGQRSLALLIAVGPAAGLLVDPVIKHLFVRVRPPVYGALIRSPESLSYPSGHAFSSLVFLALAAFVCMRLARRHPGVWVAVSGACALGALMVGLSRVYLGVHWMSDVIGGWALATAWVAVLLGSFTALSDAVRERRA